MKETSQVFYLIAVLSEENTNHINKTNSPYQAVSVSSKYEITINIRIDPVFLHLDSFYLATLTQYSSTMHHCGHILNLQ